MTDQPRLPLPELVDAPHGVPRDIARLFERFAFDVINTGQRRYSARAILHRARWHTTVEQGKRGFKVNNQWSAPLARWFMRRHPRYAGFFETRERHGEG